MTDVPERRSATVERWVPMRELVHVTERIQRMLADADKIDARLAEGVLAVRVPKTQRDQRRRVEIRAA